MTTPRATEQPGQAPARTAAPVVVPRCTIVQHVALRSADLARARDFYVEALGFPLLMETTTMCVVLAGQTTISVHGPAGASALDDAPDDACVGVEHLVLGCEGDAELERVARALAELGVHTGGIRVDELFGRRYVAFRDPDGIRWEISAA